MPYPIPAGTIPETNSLHLKTWHPKRKVVFQPSIYRFQGGSNHSSQMHLGKLRTSWKKCIEDAEQKDPRRSGRNEGGNGWGHVGGRMRAEEEVMCFLPIDVELPKGWLFYWFLYIHPYLGKWSNLAIIFKMGWKHQLVTLNSCWPHLGQSQFCWASRNEEIS